jgi:hypothetical protein
MKMKIPYQFVTVLTLASLSLVFSLAGCGSASDGPTQPSGGPREGWSGPGPKARPKASPEDEEGSIVSAQTTKTPVNPRDFSAAPPTADEPATPVPAYTKKLVTADLSNLSSTENTLLAFGLKIVVTKDAKGSPKSVDWDYKLMDSVDVSVYSAIPALENYAKVGHDFLSKYDQEFTIDGSAVTSERLAQREIATIVAKIQLVENSVDSLKKKMAKKKK